jgi:hypothetical protein
MKKNILLLFSMYSFTCNSTNYVAVPVVNVPVIYNQQVPVHESMNNSQSNSPIKETCHFKLINNNQISLANSILYGDKLCDQIDPFHGKVIFYYIIPKFMLNFSVFSFSDKNNYYDMNIVKAYFILNILELIYKIFSGDNFRNFFFIEGNVIGQLLLNFFKYSLYFTFCFYFIILDNLKKIKDTFSIKEDYNTLILNSIVNLDSISQDNTLLNQELKKCGVLILITFYILPFTNMIYYSIFYFYAQEKFKKEQSEIKKMFQLKYNQQAHTFENVNENTAKKLENIFVNNYS